MNENIKVFAEVISGVDGSLTYSLATIQDLRELKKKFQIRSSNRQTLHHMYGKIVMLQ